MGGRGTYASGNPVPYKYKSVGSIEGIKVLEGIDGAKHNLPEEAHSSSAYIRLKPNGTFHEMRFYDKDHYLIKEIAYHPEPKLNNGNRQENVLHVHEYPEKDNFMNRPPRRITQAEYQKYKKYFKGVPQIDQW